MSSWKEKLIKGLKNPWMALLVLLPGRFWDRLDDEAYLRFLFRARTGKKLNLHAPKSFNEKLQWLKLYDRRPEYSIMADKVAVRQFIAEKLGEEYLIPCLGVWERPEDIDFDSLPEQFVLKCNHNSGTGMYICKDKSKMDLAKVKAELHRGISENYYLHGREWPYKNIKPRIIAERYMVDESGVDLKDYKVFCFDGVPRLIQVDFDRFVDHRRNVYSVQWDLLELQIEFPRDASKKIEKPQQLEKLLQLASEISKGIPHLRADFYIIGDRIYFGEMTFFHGSGLERFTPEAWGKTLGDWITLPEKEL